ncbi:MAG: NADH-quinone oxidoreductase subunit J [Candidatus Asgardarchaeia archaeon]
MILDAIIFFTLAGIIILSAIMVLEAKEMIHAAFFLGILLITVGELYFILAAEYIGVIQILVYAGGVTVVMLFALMLAPTKETLHDSIAPIKNLILILLIIPLILMNLKVVAGYIQSPFEFNQEVLYNFAIYLLNNYSSYFLLLVALLIAIMLSSSYLAERRIRK